MLKREFPIILSLVLSASIACNGATGGGESSAPTTKQLVAPTQAAAQAAGAMKNEFPNARIFFSQNSGEILWLDSNGAPFARGSIDTSAHALNVVQAFVQARPALYRLDDPSQELGASDADLRTQGKGHGVVSLHFEQLYQGSPVLGLAGTAFFDATGNLLALQTHLSPSAALAQATDTGGATAAPALRTAAPLPAVRAGSRRVWRALDASGRYRLLDERIERHGIRALRILTDPATGERVQTMDETPADLTTPPADWADQPMTQAAAHDSLGDTLSIPSTQASGTLVLGFHLPGIHRPGMSANVADAGASADRADPPTQPLATTAGDWLSEPAFDPNLRAASTLATHLLTTLEWYQQNLGWSSWDGKGTTIYAAIRGNLSGTSTPELNAWGTSGMLMIGDGLTATGQPLSDALDIVAHEFTHSVVSATTPLAYREESGALNESLADIFGKTVQGFPDFVMGTEAGAHFRDLADPEHCASPDGKDCTQPGHYSGYRIMPLTTDFAGVHTNSGIVNRALTRVIEAAPPAQLSDAANGLAARSIALTRLILDSMTEGNYDAHLSLEDFAAGLTAYCLARLQSGSLQATQGGLCAQLEESFTEAELLATPM